jgi:DNA-binding protein HU-beta
MNKAELVDSLSSRTEHPKGDCEKMLDALTEIISETISGGEDVKLVGFGTFGVSDRMARVGRNPQTGVEVRIPPRRVPHFRPGKELKELILNKPDE